MGIIRDLSIPQGGLRCKLVSGCPTDPIFSDFQQKKKKSRRNKNVIIRIKPANLKIIKRFLCVIMTRISLFHYCLVHLSPPGHMDVCSSHPIYVPWYKSVIIFTLFFVMYSEYKMISQFYKYWAVHYLRNTKYFNEKNH